MIKRIIPIALLGISVCGFIACKNKQGGDFQMKDGLEYKIVKDVPGDRRPVIGDYVKLHIHMMVDTAVIADSRKLNNNEPIEMQMITPQFKGDWTSGLTLLTEGDSAIFRVSADTIKKAIGQLPPYIKPGQKIEFRVVLVSVKSKDEYKKEMDDKSASQKGIDDKILQDYFVKNNIKPTKTASGLYYTIQKEGTGDNPKPGDSVSVNYDGTLLNGEKFDSNKDHGGAPFTFTIGQHQVIEGWDEGIALLKKGSKATLYVPSTLAYGPTARSEKIQANTILVFQVELVNFKNSHK